MTAVTAPVKHVQQWIGAWPSRASAPARSAARPDLRNGDAQASYLFGILSPLPLFGLLFGVAALVVGTRGLRHARRHPEVGGALRCQIGMALGAVFTVLYFAASLFLIAILI